MKFNSFAPLLRATDELGISFKGECTGYDDVEYTFTQGVLKIIDGSGDIVTISSGPTRLEVDGTMTVTADDGRVVILTFTVLRPRPLTPLDITEL